MARAAAASALERGRLSYEQRAWADAYEQLGAGRTRRDQLGADDLELLATAAYMLGRDDEYLSVLERAHRLHVENGDLLRAARAAVWLGLQLALRGEIGGATGWNSRAQRLVDRAGRDSVEQGYLVLAGGFAQAMESDWEAALETARESAEIAERHGDADLLALALMDQGQYLMRLGRVDGGPAPPGRGHGGGDGGRGVADRCWVLSCVERIDVCQAVLDAFCRATEWTAALSRWCDGATGSGAVPRSYASCTAPCRDHAAAR